MNSLFTKLAGLGLVATLFFASCEKEGDKITLNQTSTPQLSASTTTPVLAKADAAKAAVTYTWTSANYGFTAAPTYTLEFDVKGNNFKAPRTVAAGNSNSYTLTVGDLNEVFTGLGVPAGQAAELEVRLKSTLTAATGLTQSGVSSVKATPYENRELPKDLWGIIGSATPSGWDKDTDMTYDFDTKVWTITLDLTNDEYKFRANDAWALNLGDDGADGTLEPNGANIKVPAAGKYEVMLNYNASPKPIYTITKK